VGVKGAIPNKEAVMSSTLLQRRRFEDMKKNQKDLFRKLRNGFFLSSMMGITDGTFCSESGGGCIMVQLGAYLAEPTASIEDKGRDVRSFLPADSRECTEFLAEECRKATRFSDVLTCLNLATPKLEWGLEAAQCFAQAGGDLVELNVHGGYQRYLEQGKLRAMVLPENQGELFGWVATFTQLEIPLIVKFNGQSNRRFLMEVLDEMASLAVPGVHVNVRDEKGQQPNVDLVRATRTRYPGFLLASGYVRSPAHAKALFGAGADMAGIAAPVREDREYIRKLVESFRAEYGQE
jgi:tRNA-dihydrouridine synthase